MSMYSKFVKSILAQRKRLLTSNVSGKNKSLCVSYIKELSIQIEAYQNRWNEDGWKKFIQRNIDKLDYLIPNNKAGDSIRQKLQAMAC